MIFRKMILAAIMTTACVLSVNGAERHDSLRYKAEVGTTLSTGAHTPFWMVSDNYGFSSVKRNNVWLRAGIFHDLDKEKRFSWGAGIDLGVAARFERVFIPQQIYAEVKYRCLNAMIGQKEFADDILDNDLSSGGLTHSGNARPIPQLRIGIFDYADFWGCKGWFAVKGYLGYGMFTDNAWIKKWVAPTSTYVLNTLYATRAIYFKFGDKRQFPLVGELGLKMDTQFGGTWYSAEDKNGQRQSRKNPTNFKAWIKGMIPAGGDESTVAGEQTNVQGNFLGNWAFTLAWHDPKGWTVKAYYEHFFEDHSMMFFDYPWKDGLYGIYGKLPANRILSEAVIEYLYTKYQSGPVYWDHTPDINYQVSGRDSYYNHFIYNGWQNYGYGIGNPLITAPIYNKDHNMEFQQNRIEAFNIGLKGAPTAQIDWRLRASAIWSWGTYQNPNDNVVRDFSLLAEVNWHPGKLKGWEGSLSLGWDKGSLMGNSFGVGISIAKVGFIKW